MADTPDYDRLARTDAADMALHFLDQIVDQILTSGKASYRLDRYPLGQEYHHTMHVERAYDLKEADELLDQLSRFEEDDGGLWEGASPREAVKIQAAATYGNAVYAAWQALLENVNSEAEQVLPDIGPKDWSPKNKRPGSKDFTQIIGDFIRSER